MKVVKLKMLRNFLGEKGPIILYEGKIYFAFDGGDYWLVQRYLGDGFNWVVPKKPEEVTPTVYAEVVPTHTDQTRTDQYPQQCLGCSSCKPEK